MGESMKIAYQEDLRNWMEESDKTDNPPEKSQEDRVQQTKMMVSELTHETSVCTLQELEVLCKKRGILIWSVKYYDPEFYEAVIKKTRNHVMQEIIEKIGYDGYTLPQLRRMIKEMNEVYALDRHRWEISCSDLETYDPDWFQTIFKKKYVTLPGILEKTSSPRYKKVLDRQ